MASDIDRKKLWGRAGSRCAMCNCELTRVNQVESIIGDEAHIRARRAGGPRHDPSYPVGKLDTYENLVLLCKIHHKLVDDNEEVFTTAALVETKHRHERRVNAALNPKVEGWINDVLLHPIANGTELMRIVAQAHVYAFDHDHPESDAEREVIGAFLEGIRDWGDIADDIGPGGQINGAEDLHRQLLELGELGFIVLAAIGDYRLRPDLVVPGAAVRVTRLSADRNAPSDVPPDRPL